MLREWPPTPIPYNNPMTRPALLLLAALPLLAQQTGALTGHLIDSATKAPIPNATIKLPNTETTSNPQGQFHFPALPAGAHRAIITHPNYLRAEPPTVTINAANTTQFTAELTPFAQLAGRVTSPNREPIPATIVGLRRPWDEQWIQTAQTNADGRFHFRQLEPGTWILAALPGFGYTSAKPANSVKPLPDPEIPEEQNQRLGWAATFYPNAVNYTDAARIALRPGAQLDGYDIRLRTRTLRRITGTVLHHNGAPAPKALISISDPANKGVNGQLVTADANGHFEFTTASDGDWRLFAQQKRGDESAKGYTDVRVSRTDREDIELRLALPFPLSGTVDREEPPDSQGNRKVTAIYLIPQGASADVQTEAFHQQDGSFTLKKVYPGRYRVLPAGYVPGYYVESIWYGDRDVTAETIEIANPPLPLRIVYKPKAGRATGTVPRAAGHSVVLVPQDEALRDAHQFIRTAKCGPDGRFSIDSLRPGDYYAFAFDRVRTEQLEDIDFVRTLTIQATRATIRPGETATLELSPHPWPDY